MPESLGKANEARLRIGKWEVEPRRNLISCVDGAVRLEPKVIELLVHLARRPGEVISRNDLLAAVWPNVVVNDETLTQAINKLRRSLGDDAHVPTYIETVSKRGYRLVAPVAPAPASAPGSLIPQRRRHWPWLAALMAGGVALVLLLVNARWPIAVDDFPGARDPLPIVAVLPLANQSGDPGRDYFCDGVTEDIIGALGRFSGLRVISRSSVEQYKDSAPSAKVIRDALGARYVVTGSIRESGGELRVGVELSDAERGVVLWTERFVGAGTDVFRIQDQIVTSIVGHLAVKVTKQERERAALKPASNLQAYDLALRARPLRSVSRTANREARNMLTRALQLAPDYAEAQVQLAIAEIRQIEGGWVEHPVDTLASVEKRLLAALAIDDPGANARAHGLLGVVHLMRGNFDQALAEVDRAVALNPSDAYAVRSQGITLLFLGRIDEAITTLETARRYDPASESAAGDFGRALAYYTARRYGEALAAVDLGLARFPGEGFLHATRAATLAQMGELQAAREAVARLAEVDPAFQMDSFGTRFRDPQHMTHLRDGLRKAGL